jgi:transposase
LLPRKTLGFGCYARYQASAIIASIGDGHQFRNGREFAAWLGLTPANKSSGGKEKLRRITKMGDHTYDPCWSLA